MTVTVRLNGYEQWSERMFALTERVESARKAKQQADDTFASALAAYQGGVDLMLADIRARADGRVINACSRDGQVTLRGRQ
jgi:multidrug resistance efflux pump